MKNRKHRKALWISLIVFVLIAIPVGLCFGGSVFDSDAGVFAENAKIALPKDMEEIYGKNGPTDAQGHGDRYAVYKMKNMQDTFLSDFSTAEDSEMETAVETILSGIGADRSLYPDFSGSYRLKTIRDGTRRFYMIFDDETYLLYLVQNIP